MDSRVLKSMPLALSTESPLACISNVPMLPTAFTRDSSFFCWPGVSNKCLMLTEVEVAKVSSNQTLWPMCCSLPLGFSLSLHFAQSANRTRLNRPPSLRCSVEKADRGPPLVLGSRGQIAQTGQHVYVDNIGIVRDHVAQVHMGSNESRQDFEESRLMLHEISVSFLGLGSTSSSCGPFQPWNVLVAFARGSDAL